MFRRTGHTDDRRRRVLTEEVVAGAPGRTPSGARSMRAGDGHAYADAARRDQQPRVTDLVPRRMRVVALGWGLSAAMIAGLEVLYASVAGNGAAVAAPLDIAHAGSVAAWFSSVLLLASAALSVLLYTLRRHKQSDYHGRYRVWLWFGAAVLGMSLCSVAPLHLTLADWLAARTGWHPPGGTLAFWLAPVSLLLGYVGVRLLLEIRGSRLALLALLVSVASYMAAVVLPALPALKLSALHVVMLSAGCRMGADLFLLLSVVLFARHVLLDVEGLLPVSKSSAAATAASNASGSSKSSSSTSSSANGNSSGTSTKIDPAHATPPAPASRGNDDDDDSDSPRRRYEEAEDEDQWYQSKSDNDRRNRGKSAPPANSYDADADDDELSPQGRKLSKTERKRLRKLKSQQRESEFN
ncbi:MAG: hypothetical protein K8T25_10325 [Planctomycetia bacterium]|nr:hypothetical protein [Planctomycetia bacterium]